MRFLAVIPLLALLTACGGQEVTGARGVAISPSDAAADAAPDVQKCGGTHGVSVSPCPVVLSKKTRGYAVFFVNGRGVINVYLRGYQLEGNCYSKSGGEICSVENLGSPPNYWQAASGTDCGRAKTLKFYAYGVSGFIGVGYLRIINRYCP